MNRRTSIKKITYLGVLGATSFSFYKWIEHKPEISIGEIDRYKSLIAELAETIIPRTDTPGAKDAKVEDFIILMVKDCDDEKIQRNFLRGLLDLKVYAKEKYNSDFVDCSGLDKIEILNHFKNSHMSSNALINKARNKLFGISFYNHLHALTVQGFCTSELGATQVLAYDYIPGNYEGCVPFESHQKAWAT